MTGARSGGGEREEGGGDGGESSPALLDIHAATLPLAAAKTCFCCGHILTRLPSTAGCLPVLWSAPRNGGRRTDTWGAVKEESLVLLEK